MPVPSGDDDDDDSGTVARAIQVREKTRKVSEEEEVAFYINHRNEGELPKAPRFSNRNKVEDSQARRLEEYGYHFSSASAAESTRNGVGQFMSA